MHNNKSDIGNTNVVDDNDNDKGNHYDNNNDSNQ